MPEFGSFDAQRARKRAQLASRLAIGVFALQLPMLGLYVALIDWPAGAALAAFGYATLYPLGLALLPQLGHVRWTEELGPPLAAIACAAVCVVTGGLASPYLPTFASVPAGAAYREKESNVVLAIASAVLGLALLTALDVGGHAHRLPRTDAYTLHLLYLSGILHAVTFVSLSFVARTAAHQASLRGLKEARQDAETAAEAKSRFLAMMSHELRTPLGAVVSTVDLLRRTELDPEQRALVEIMGSGGRGLMAVINDVLDFSRLDAEGLELERLPMDPALVVREVCELMQSNAAEKGLTFRTDLADEGVTGLGDPRCLTQVAMNLIGNAIKFTESGTIEVRTSWTGEPEDRRFELVVQDTGIGIPTDQLDRIFEPFMQGDSSISRRYGGSGLGLSITRRLVEQGDGTLSVNTGPEGGCTFTVQLPLPSSPDTLPRPIERPVPPETVPSLRVLVVDDNDLNRTMLSVMMARLGHRCDAVSDGSEAVTHALRDPYDVILMDMNMPGLSGLDATRAIQSEGPNSRTPIIGVSADAMPSHIEAGLAGGLSAYLVKPVLLDELSATIQAFTERPPAR